MLYHCKCFFTLCIQIYQLEQNNIDKSKTFLHTLYFIAAVESSLDSQAVHLISTFKNKSDHLKNVCKYFCSKVFFAAPRGSIRWMQVSCDVEFYEVIRYKTTTTEKVLFYCSFLS